MPRVQFQDCRIHRPDAAGRRVHDHVGEARAEGARQDVRVYGLPQVGRAEHAGGNDGFRGPRRAPRGRPDTYYLKDHYLNYPCVLVRCHVSVPTRCGTSSPARTASSARGCGPNRPNAARPGGSLTLAGRGHGKPSIHAFRDTRFRRGSAGTTARSSARAGTTSPSSRAGHTWRAIRERGCEVRSPMLGDFTVRARAEEDTWKVRAGRRGDRRGESLRHHRDRTAAGPAAGGSRELRS